MSESCPPDEFRRFCDGGGGPRASGSANGTGCVTARSCQRGDLVPPALQYYAHLQACDGYPDCELLEDEWWALDAATGGRRGACPHTSVPGLAAAAATLGCLALAIVLACSLWSAFRQKKPPEVHPLGSAYAVPLLAAAGVGSAAAVGLGLGAQAMLPVALRSPRAALCSPRCAPHDMRSSGHSAFLLRPHVRLGVCSLPLPATQ
eukprot:SAG22_NODE_4484_length_1255_cov_1.517301_1_plen_205_part_00